MSLAGIALIIIAVAFLVLVMTLLPTIAAVKKTAASVGELTDMLNTELKPAIQELTAVVAEMKIVGGGLRNTPMMSSVSCRHWVKPAPI